MTNSPVALEAYEVLAEEYAAIIDTKPHNAYYERPATESLLPDVAGLQVLDAGCGPGVYAELPVPTFRRSLEETLNPFLEAGFRLERILRAEADEGVPGG